MRTVMWRLVLSAVMVVSFQSRVRAAEEKIKPGDLPKSVVSSLNARFPGLTITSVTRETEADGKVLFDIELKQKDRRFETDIQKDGTILEVEKEVFAKHWPDALRSTVEAKFPNAKIKEVLEVNKVTGGKEVPDHLEVDIETADKKSAEILVLLDGRSETQETASAPAKPAAPVPDVKIKLSELPSLVTEAVKAKFPKGEIKAAEKGEEDSKPIFEVTVNEDHHDTDVTLSPKGEIMSMEKSLKASELPRAMTKSLRAKYPHYTIKLIEEVWENGKHTGYEGTIITANKKTVAVNFDPQGKLIEDNK